MISSVQSLYFENIEDYYEVFPIVESKYEDN